MTTPAHPGNDYYVNAVTHTIQRQSNPIAAAALRGSGWLGPYPWDQAKAVAAGLAATTPNPVTGVPTGVTGKGAANLGGVAAIGDFFNRLTQSSTWIRVGEFVAGAILLYIAVNALTRDTAAGNALNSAKNTGKRVAAATVAGV